MNIKQIAFFLAISTLFSVTAYSEPLIYEESRTGNYFYMNPFSEKPDTAAEHWGYAESLREQGKQEEARKQFKIFVKRWPEDLKAPAAQQAVGDLYVAEGKDLKAFKAYEALIQKYYTGLKDYDYILDTQYRIAQDEMRRKRMKWMFGGYSSPERAIPLLESILRNAPQWDRAPEMQHQIGETYRKNGDEELAVVAYTSVEYRYSDSAFAERAGYGKILSFKELVSTTPYSVDIRERAEIAAEIFLMNYPASTHLLEVQQFKIDLLELEAQYAYEVGEFYANAPKNPRKESARIYYKKVVREHPETTYATRATEKLTGPVAEVGVTAATAASVPAAGAIGPGESFIEPQPLPEVLSEDPEAVDVSADTLEYDGEFLIGEGHVAIQQKGASLQADRVTVNQETGDINAIGNVVMLRDDARWEGRELLYNFKTRVGSFEETILNFEPAYIVAEKTERVATNEFLMINARITTCSGDDPVIYAKAKELRVIDEDKESGMFIQAKNVTFYIKDVPVFYLPRWQRHLGYRVFTSTVGYDGRLGFFFLGSAELHPTDWLLSDTHLDFYSSRGVGIGQDFKWRQKEIIEGVEIDGEKTEDLEIVKGVGSFQSYYIQDSSPYESTKTPAEEAAVGSSRYRIKVEHRQELNDETYFTTKVNYLSDPFILNDFFPNEFKRNANPENYAVVQHANDEYAASVRIDRRLNDFYTTVDRVPELLFDWYRAQIGDSRFYYESESSLAFLEKAYGDINPEANTNQVAGVTNQPVAKFPNYDSGRFDTYHQVFRPFRFNDYLNVIPRAAYRGTWYSDTITGSGDLRNIFEFGTLMSYKTYKTLALTSGFYGDGLHHILEPYAEYLYRPEPSLDPSELYQFDEIDAYDKQHVVRFGTRNFLQTKRGEDGRIANFIDADLYTSLRVEKETGEEDFGPLEGDVEVSFTDYLNFQSDFEFDWYDAEFQDFNARIGYTTEDMSFYSFEYRYLRDERMLFTPYARLFPNEKWSYEFYLQYDAEFGEWYERSILVNHKFDCLGMGLGLKLDSDNEPTFWFQLWLNAFPETMMGMGR